MKPEVSEEQFWELANEDSNYELIDGVLIIHSPASEEHEDIFAHLTTILRFYLQEYKLGKIYGSRFVMKLSAKWNPEPDIMIILPENYTRITKTKLEGPADIVIEILTKATKEIDVTKKLPKYLEEGVQEVWILDPEERSIKIITKQEEKSWNNPQSEEFLTSAVLRDLKLRVKWIWEREKYPANEIIKIMIK